MKTLKEFINESEQFQCLYWIDGDGSLVPTEIDESYATFYWHAFPIEYNIESLIEDYADEIGDEQTELVRKLMNKSPEKLKNLTFYCGRLRAGVMVFGVVGNIMKKNEDKFPVFSLYIRPNELGDWLKTNLGKSNTFMKKFCR